MDPQLVRFRRQYFQLFEPDFLTWPPKSLLRDAGVQQWLYKQCFDTDANPHLPADRYRLRVLKPLLRKVEQAIEDPEEDVGSHPSAFLRFSFSLPLVLSLELHIMPDLFVLIFLPTFRRYPMISCPVSLPSWVQNCPQKPLPYSRSPMSLSPLSPRTLHARMKKGLILP